MASHLVIRPCPKGEDWCAGANGWSGPEYPTCEGCNADGTQTVEAEVKAYYDSERQQVHLAADVMFGNPEDLLGWEVCIDHGPFDEEMTYSQFKRRFVPLVMLP